MADIPFKKRSRIVTLT